MCRWNRDFRLREILSVRILPPVQIFSPMIFCPPKIITPCKISPVILYWHYYNYTFRTGDQPKAVTYLCSQHYFVVFDLPEEISAAVGYSAGTTELFVDEKLCNASRWRFRRLICSFFFMWECTFYLIFTAGNIISKKKTPTRPETFAVYSA